MENLEYVLKFALQVIEDNELEHTMNSENWVIGKAIEEQLEKLKNCSIHDVSQQRELLPDFLYEDNGLILSGVHGDSDVTERWKEYLEKIM